MKIVLTLSLTLLLMVSAFAQRDTELYGYIRYNNQSAARGVVVSIGNFSVATDQNGFYKIGYLRPGVKEVFITPPGKQTRSFRVVVGNNATHRDFTIDW
jgi:hypothetical protein